MYIEDTRLYILTMGNKNTFGYNDNSNVDRKEALLNRLIHRSKKIVNKFLKNELRKKTKRGKSGEINMNVFYTLFV